MAKEQITQVLDTRVSLSYKANYNRDEKKNNISCTYYNRVFICAAEQPGDHETGRQLHRPLTHHRQGRSDHQEGHGRDQLSHSLSR